MPAVRSMEPPRCCPARRPGMVVQVTPPGWAASCVEHGIRVG
ncbi:biotin synthase auxiliary protein BsaP [Streptosporangium soli]